MQRKVGDILGPILMMMLVLLLVSPGIVSAADQKVANSPKAFVFNDLSDNDPNVVFINYLTSKSIINGFPDGTFRPAEGLTRAQAAVLMIRAGGIAVDPSLSVPYIDIKADYWGYASIGAAVQAGYINGFADKSFRPEEKLTRAQAATMILRLSKQKLSETAYVGLSDMSSDHWAASSVAVAVAAGMMQASSDGKQFYPDQAMTRREMARALSVLLTEDPGLYKTELTGAITVKSGTVSIQKDQLEAVKITGTSIVVAGDTIITGSKAEAEISFEDGSGFLLKENTQVTITEARGRAYIKQDGNPAVAVDWLDLNFKKGKIFGVLPNSQTGEEQDSSAVKTTGYLDQFKSPLLAGLKGFGLVGATAGTQKTSPWYNTSKTKKVKVKVDMPWGVAAIRGTQFNVYSNPNGYSGVTVLNGTVSFTSGGQTVSIESGQMVQGSDSNMPPPSPALMDQNQLKDWNAVGTWVLQQAAQMQQNGELNQTEYKNIVNIVNNALKDVQSNIMPDKTSGSRGGSGQTDIFITAITTPATMALYVGGTTGTITAAIVPSNATNQNVAWSSSDTNIATVADGVVTAVAAGTVTITVTTVDGGYTAMTLVTVVGMAKAVETGDFENKDELNAAINAMWTSAYIAGTFDATKITHDYVDKMAAALSINQYLYDVAIPAELVIPPGKTFASAQIKHDVNNYLDDTDAVKVEANWGNKLIAWMNTNMAYGWSQPDDNLVKYTYVVTWTDDTTTDYAITFKDADPYVNGNIVTLDQVEQPEWNVEIGDILDWGSVSNAVGYEVQLYKNGVLVDGDGTVSIEDPNENYCDLSTAILAAGAGIYTATVKAIGDGINYLDGPISEISDANCRTTGVMLDPTIETIAGTAEITEVGTTTVISGAELSGTLIVSVTDGNENWWRAAVDVAAGDDEAAVAGKIRAALTTTDGLADYFTVSGEDTDIILTQSEAFIGSNVNLQVYINVTSIQIADNQVVSYISNYEGESGGSIYLNYNNQFTPTVADLKAAIESIDGSNQTYAVIDDYNIEKTEGSIADREYLLITAEDGITQARYNIYYGAY